MTTAEKQQLVKRLQEGRARARALRPERLAATERALDDAGARYYRAKQLCDYRLMAAIRQEIEDLGKQRTKLQLHDEH